MGHNTFTYGPVPNYFKLLDFFTYLEYNFNFTFSVTRLTFFRSIFYNRSIARILFYTLNYSLSNDTVSLIPQVRDIFNFEKDQFSEKNIFKHRTKTPQSPIIVLTTGQLHFAIFGKFLKKKDA